MTSAPSKQPFKACTKCGFLWNTCADFLSDPRLKLVGYQVNFEHLSDGLFLFNHFCETTIAVPASSFCHLHKGPIYSERATGTAACPGFCLYRDNLNACPARCECAYVRAIIQRINTWPKKRG
ncbi:hypothetical protein GX586_03600 [bacterium]|nr:hypothetical protein [bacterium]